MDSSVEKVVLREEGNSDHSSLEYQVISFELKIKGTFERLKIGQQHG